MEMKKKYSLSAIIIILGICASANFWKEDRIKVDAPSYYTYLPAAFIYHDLHLDFIDTRPDFFRDKIWYYKIEGGSRLIKHPMGVSVALSPFFLVGHLITKMTGGVQDGYSLTYQNAVSVGVLLYLFLGLFYLRKLLLDYFSETITAITLFAVVVGTNLFWYSTFEGLMPHAVSFSFWCFSLYSFFRWLTTEQKKYIFIFAVCFGIIVLIRPFSIVGILYFIIQGIFSKRGIVSFITYLKLRFTPVMIAIVISCAIASLQFFYWKYATGKWIYDVYIDEHFLFKSPQMLPFLFSFRKGLFIYTPILLFSIIGLIKLFKSDKGLFYGTIITLFASIYVLSSWWAWSYGICWGMRPMIDYYAMLSIPLASGFSVFLSKGNLTKYITGIIISVLIILNLFQTWQYKNGLIHYDDMTKESYFIGFFQTKESIAWKDALKPYDWGRRIKGLPQIEYSSKLIENLSDTDEIYFRGNNLYYWAINPKAENMVGSYFEDVKVESLFTLTPAGDGNVYIRASNGYYLSAIHQYNNILAATSGTPSNNEKFSIEYLKEGDNKIALKAANGKYLSVSTVFPYVVSASGNDIKSSEIMRFYIFNRE